MMLILLKARGGFPDAGMSLFSNNTPQKTGELLNKFRYNLIWFDLIWSGLIPVECKSGYIKIY